MTVATTTTHIVSDRSGVFAVSVGHGKWVTGRLRGRTFTTDQALSVVQFADAVVFGRELAPFDHPIWTEALDWVRIVGLSIREAVILLELPCDPRELPAVLPLGGAISESPEQPAVTQGRRFRIGRRR